MGELYVLRAVVGFLFVCLFVFLWGEGVLLDGPATPMVRFGDGYSLKSLRAAAP